MKLYILLLVVFTAVLCTVAVKPAKHQRTLNLLNKKQKEYLKSSQNKVQILHYLIKLGNKYQIKTIPTRDFNIESKFKNRWLGKSIFDNSINETGYITTPFCF